MPMEQLATKRAMAFVVGTPIATTTSSPGVSPKANKPFANRSAWNKFKPGSYGQVYL